MGEKEIFYAEGACERSCRLKETVIVFDLSVQNKGRADSQCRKDNIIYCRFIPKCDGIRQNQGSAGNKRSGAGAARPRGRR